MPTMVEIWKAEGVAEGIAKGKTEGKTETAREIILESLREKFGKVPKHIERAINQMNDPKLKRNRHRLPALIEEVRKRISPCRLCERQCNVNRLSGEVGFCGLDHRLRLFASANLYNEGPLVGAPTLGIYLSGCAFRCRTCYRSENWNTAQGTLFTPEQLAVLLDGATESGSRSWMFLGGNPDQSVLGILEALQFVKSDIPVVWNTASWSTPEILSILKEIVDIWIIDIKFGNNECAVRESGVSDYVETITRNIELLQDESHIVLRHGVQLEHIECCSTLIRCQVNQWDHAYLEHEIFEYINGCATAPCPGLQ